MHIFFAFIIARVIALHERSEGWGPYSVNMYNQKDNNFIYGCINDSALRILSYSKLHRILSYSVFQEDGTILVDQDCLQTIFFNCFIGDKEEDL